MAKYTGFVEFGSDDSSIVAEASLKTAASISDVGAGSALASGASIDSSKGVLCGLNGAVMLVPDSLPLGIEKAGQMSFRVTTTAIAAEDAANGSTGTARANNTYLLTFRNSATGIPYGRWWESSVQKHNFEMNTDDAHLVLDFNEGGTASQKITSLGKGETTLITISWQYGQAKVFIDNEYAGTQYRTNFVADFFNYIWLGSNRGAVSSGSSLTFDGAYFSDFVMSSSPVQLSSNYNLKKVVMFGDSFVAQAQAEGSVAKYGHNAALVLEAELRKKGFEIDIDEYVDGHSGATVSDSGSANLVSFRTSMLAKNPDIVIFRAATNDITVWSTYNADFESSLQSHINAILAVADKMIICTVDTLKADSAYDNAQVVADTLAANTIIRNQVDWWNTNNPSRAGDLILCDMFELLGGENPESMIFQGDIAGDNFHYSSKGQRLWGEALAKYILK